MTHGWDQIRNSFFCIRSSKINGDEPDQFSWDDFLPGKSAQRRHGNLQIYSVSQSRMCEILKERFFFFFFFVYCRTKTPSLDSVNRECAGGGAEHARPTKRSRSQHVSGAPRKRERERERERERQGGRERERGRERKKWTVSRKETAILLITKSRLKSKSEKTLTSLSRPHHI